MNNSSSVFISKGVKKLLRYNSENVSLAQNKEVFAVKLYFCSGVFAVNNFVIDLNIHGLACSVFKNLACSYSNNNTLYGLFFYCLGKYESALCHIFMGRCFDNYSVSKWFKFHKYPS